ncbi:uncharacterized protein LOC129193040 [Dunckerocampus dactyliophorus]|uniref:uncharacterized protein LOC129193040 n=1 Tax=Dunckerocampus dactyliophorus TaxID=161453 RepID=UPI002405FF56|nr:uncharacterized protein LOC129193040 [Dunckerocampus dactyliophorus]
MSCNKTQAMVVISTEEEWSSLVCLLEENVADKEEQLSPEGHVYNLVLDDCLISLHYADVKPDMTQENISQVMNACFTSCKDGINTFLLLVPGGHYTTKQMRLLEILQAHFGTEAFKYLVVVSLEDGKVVTMLDDTLLELINTCDGRYCRMTSPSARDKVNALVSMVDYMLAESGSTGYSQSMLADAKKRSTEDTAMRMLRQKVQEAEEKVQAFQQMVAQREERRAKEVEELREKHDEERRNEAAERRQYEAKKESLEEAVVSHKAILHFQMRPEDEDDTDKMSVVLLGLSGSGKTSALRLILQRAGNQYPFTGCTDEDPQPTVVCERREVCTGGKRLILVDTPELWDEDGVVNLEQVKDCLALALPGPHIYLLVLQVGRFTQGESEMLTQLQKIFGRDAVEHSMVLFVHMNQGPQRSQRIHNYVAGAHTMLHELTRRCGSRYYELSLAKTHNGMSYPQVRQLLSGINKLVASHGGRAHVVKRFTAQELQERKKITEDVKDRAWEANFLLKDA